MTTTSSRATARGRNIRFGIREHGMCSIMNGIAAHGIFRPSGATFLVFADYCRPSIRLAALSHLAGRSTSSRTTASPSARTARRTSRSRPSRACASSRTSTSSVRPIRRRPRARSSPRSSAPTGPTLLALSRQAVPLLSRDPGRRRAARASLKGGYVAKKETAPLELILLSAGSELQHALKAAETLGAGTRVVSMPCFSRFDRQPADVPREVLPRACRRRVAIEATVTSTWAKYVGLDGVSIGIDRFGMSAPGATVMKELGITAEHVLEAVKSLPKA